MADDLDGIGAELEEIAAARPRATRCQVCRMAQKHNLVNPVIRRGREGGFAFSVITMLLNQKFGDSSNRLKEDGMQVRDHYANGHA